MRTLAILLCLLALGVSAAEPAPRLKVVVLGITARMPAAKRAELDPKKSVGARRLTDMRDAMDFILANTASMERVALPEDRAGIDADAFVQHVALVDSMLEDLAWKHVQGKSLLSGASVRPEESRWSIGAGLAPLAAATGAEHGLVLHLQDSELYHQIGVLDVLGAAALTYGASGGTGVGVPMAMAKVTVGLVDLRTGRIVWVNNDYRNDGGTGRESLFEAVDSLLCQYPKSLVMGERGPPPRCKRDVEFDDEGKPGWD